MDNLTPTEPGLVELKNFLQEIVRDMHSHLPEECMWATHQIVDLMHECDQKIVSIKQKEEYERLSVEFAHMSDTEKSMLRLGDPHQYGRYQHASKMANLPAISTTAEYMKALKTPTS
jgi:hypothetical protein